MEGCRIEVLSPLTRERWRLDRPAVLLQANFPSKNKTIRFLPFLPRRIAFLLQLLWLPFFLTFQTQLKVMHTILHLMGVAVTVALTFPTPADFFKNGDFFPELSFLLRVDKNGLEGCNSGWNFPWWSSLARPSPFQKLLALSQKQASCFERNFIGKQFYFWGHILKLKKKNNFKIC